MIDTLDGPESISKVKEHIESNFPDKELLIIFTHYHYDHTWGACAFENPKIIAHEKCFDLMPKTERRLAENPELAAGNVGIIYPELTFKDTLTFKKEKLVLVYTPGHTEDCISVHDEIDRVLYVGDNIEKPLPYLLSPNLDQYIKTLKYYKSLPFDKLICSHNGLIETESIDFQIEYIKKFIAGNHSKYSDDLMAAIHKSNLESQKSLIK
ncbi:MAG: hypothetical protein PWQ27_1697 [Kosmotoga sp.]|nr:hypothetical protein [Kosmotoga sp.]